MMLQGRLTGTLDFNDVFPLQNPTTIPILQMRKWQHVEITQLESGNTHIQNQTTCLWSPQSSPLCHAVQIKNERDRLMLNIEITFWFDSKTRYKANMLPPGPVFNSHCAEGLPGVIQHVGVLTARGVTAWPLRKTQKASV